MTVSTACTVTPSAVERSAVEVSLNTSYTFSAAFALGNLIVAVTTMLPPDTVTLTLLHVTPTLSATLHA